jgi:tRNA U34 2-thiouridine synthase MnmA/TrmU
MTKKVKALALLSGGLDSTLAIRTLLEQGIEVTALSFETPFFGTGKAEIAAKKLGVPIIKKDFSAEHWEIVKRPPHGRGKQMNPCIDCHGLMFRIAGEIAKKEGFDFISTGEVLGQRPMSQNLRALKIVEKLADLENKILRPLCAQNLPETIPEQAGLVDRTKLFDFSGKNRKPQIALAARWGITDYPTPAGGCKLTEPGYADRLKGLFAHQGEDPELADTRLLSLGRVFFLGERSLTILGRSEAENEKLEKMQLGAADYLVQLADDLAGPTALVRVHAPDEAAKVLAEAAAKVREYSKAAREAAGEVKVVAWGKEGKEI